MGRQVGGVPGRLFGVIYDYSYHSSFARISSIMIGVTLCDSNEFTPHTFRTRVSVYDLSPIQATSGQAKHQETPLTTPSDVDC